MPGHVCRRTLSPLDCFPGRARSGASRRQTHGKAGDVRFGKTPGWGGVSAYGVTASLQTLQASPEPTLPGVSQCWEEFWGGLS